MYMLTDACLKEISWNSNHDEKIAYLNWPIDESYCNHSEIEFFLSCDITYVLEEIG